MNKTIDVRKTVVCPTDAQLTLAEAETVLLDTESATAEACMSAAETYNGIIKNIKVDVQKLRSAANLKAEVYGLSYDEDNVQLSVDGSEILMEDANGGKWWVKITPTSTDVDITRLNAMMRDAIYKAVPWIQNAAEVLHLFDIRFDHNRPLEDAHVNKGDLPQEMVEFFTSRQLSLFAEEISDKKVRPYDGSQLTLFNIKI